MPDNIGITETTPMAMIGALRKALKRLRYHGCTIRVTDPMLGFKAFWSAQRLIEGNETMHMIKKGQLRCTDGQAMSAADHFYNLAL